jgi:hypothetical protein
LILHVVTIGINLGVIWVRRSFMRQQNNQCSLLAATTQCAAWQDNSRVSSEWQSPKLAQLSPAAVDGAAEFNGSLVKRCAA